MAAYNEQGRYTVRVIEQKFGESANGKPGIFFTIQPTAFHGQQGAVDLYDAQQRTIGLYFSTPENAAISIEQLRRLGWHGTSFRDLEDVEAWSLVDMELAARCEHNDYTKDGQQRTGENWSFVTGSGGMKVNDTNKAKVRDLDARFGHLLKNGAPTSGGRERQTITKNDVGTVDAALGQRPQQPQRQPQQRPTQTRQPAAASAGADEVPF